MKSSQIEKAYKLAKEQYAECGVDTDKVLRRLAKTAVSMHCWQGDDVAGFERLGATLDGGGIQVTGNFPGKPRDIEEYRADLDKAYSLIPGKHRLNLHSIYGDFKGQAPDRTQFSPEHFKTWVEWAKERDLKLDFNPTCFSHPLAESGFTLSSKDESVRRFWIEHVQCCREIAAVIGQAQHNPCIHNIWIPDGSKDLPADRWGYRDLLKKSLQEIFSIDYSPEDIKDAVECKLFGIGSEAFVVGSHEFYMAMAVSMGKMACFDMGHFHPTESVADKISAILQFSDELLLHVSRGVRWDSDHVVTLNDEVLAVAQEIVRGNALDRVHIALDYFDASMNRVGAWVIGMRAVMRALLMAMLEPTDRLLKYEQKDNLFGRLAFMEELKSMPHGAVWDFHCLQQETPSGSDWLEEIDTYEKQVLSHRE